MNAPTDLLALARMQEQTLRQLQEAVQQLGSAHSQAARVETEVERIHEMLVELRQLSSGKDSVLVRLAVFDERWQRLERCLTSHEEMHEILQDLAGKVHTLWEARITWRGWWLARVGRWAELLIAATVVYLAAQLLAPKVFHPSVVPFTQPSEPRR